MNGISGRVRFSSASFFLLVAFWSKAADAQMLVHFDLPAQPLAQSLNAIGTATNTDVGYRASWLELDCACIIWTTTRS